MTDISYPVVRAYVAKRKPEIRAEHGRSEPTRSSPKHNCPGERLRSTSARSRSGSGARWLPCISSRCGCRTQAGRCIGYRQQVVRRHPSKATFTPSTSSGASRRGRIRYDNLKAAVAQVIGLSRARVEADRWIAFKSHFDIDAFYCQPGIKGAHEKGGVEGDIGWFRRNPLVPVPAVDSLAELNDLVDGYDIDDNTRRIGGRVHTVGEAFAAEKALLKPLPVEPFETGLWLTPGRGNILETGIDSYRLAHTRVQNTANSPA